MKQLKERAADYFKSNPGTTELFGTSDGTLFLQKQHATSHGHSLEDKEVTHLTPLSVNSKKETLADDTKAPEVKAPAAKAPAVKAAKAPATKPAAPKANAKPAKAAEVKKDAKPAEEKEVVTPETDN